MRVPSIAKGVLKLGKRALWPQYGTSRLRRLLYPRRFQAYCIGTAKSGTSSIAALFRKHYQAAHEPESQHIIDIFLTDARGSLDERELIKYIKTRDKRLGLELDSSQLNYFFLDILVREFVDAKFILTLRDCYSWLDSFINHQLTRPASDQWIKLRDLRFRREGLEYAKEEKILVEHGLYTLDGYLSYWAHHNRKVLLTVPRERLLIVKTSEVSSETAKIADFLGIPLDSLDQKKSHSNKATSHIGIVSKIDKRFLEKKVETHCKELMDAYFPEMMGSGSSGDRSG